MIDVNELAQMSNQGNYQRPPKLEVNEVSLNGDKGIYRKRVIVGHKDRNSKPEEIELGKEIEVVFLKIRRKLVERGKKGEIVRQTNEHNTVNDVVRLFTDRGPGQTPEREEGIASDLRERYSGLRTVQIIYALLLTNSGVELVRIPVKGASLGSEAKPDHVMTFYQYVASYQDEHMFQYRSTLGAVLENGQREYYAMTFGRGEKISDGQMETVAEHLRQVHDVTKRQDLFYQKPVTIEAQAEGVPGAVEYPEEDINPDDIPF